MIDDLFIEDFEEIDPELEEILEILSSFFCINTYDGNN